MAYFIHSSLYLLTPYCSKALPSPLSPLVTISLVSTPVSLLPFCYTSLLYLLDSTCKWYSVYLSLTYFLSIITSKSIHVAGDGKILFFLKGLNIIPLYIHDMITSFFIDMLFASMMWCHMLLLCLLSWPLAYTITLEPLFSASYWWGDSELKSLNFFSLSSQLWY